MTAAPRPSDDPATFLMAVSGQVLSALTLIPDDGLDRSVRDAAAEIIGFCTSLMPGQQPPNEDAALIDAIALALEPEDPYGPSEASPMDFAVQSAAGIVAAAAANWIHGREVPGGWKAEARAMLGGLELLHTTIAVERGGPGA
jgi:hypothetical protein